MIRSLFLSNHFHKVSHAFPRSGRLVRQCFSSYAWLGKAAAAPAILTWLHFRRHPWRGRGHDASNSNVIGN